MSVYLEFTIEADAFHLGRVLDPPPGISLELERVVPTGSMVVPFVWVTGEDYSAFERGVRSHSAVESLTALDRNGEQGLYRLEWKHSPTDLIDAMARSDAVILEATGDTSWTFRLRFTNHDNLTAFHNAIDDQHISIQVKRTYTLTKESSRGQRLDLTPEQREALVLAVKWGYFASPREVSLGELAEEFGISQQATSKRIRQANEKILQEVLLPVGEDRDH
ncbi:helix-turn-helix domain-containing protein [Haloglomus litoreum]|uniref:helix-turn-helix domain-containing protein n=1 Tax=Haloglomus litoreum TaxID=3034026 RepID=UPI0023E8AF50|nr:helix-turn-helix domain-containing protein [Haloglomus sp. DT116]